MIYKRESKSKVYDVQLTNKHLFFYQQDQTFHLCYLSSIVHICSSHLVLILVLHNMIEVQFLLLLKSHQHPPAPDSGMYNNTCHSTIHRTTSLILYTRMFVRYILLNKALYIPSFLTSTIEEPWP